MSFRVVLYQPEIPANTGNIGRLCLGMGASLHLIHPIRFLMTDRHLKRAGLDYWKELAPQDYHDLSELPGDPERRWFLSTKGSIPYTQPEYQPGDCFVFGPESRGLPESILNASPRQVLRIPMTSGVRSINLSNSVAIVLYEAWRQLGFPGGQ